MRKTVGVALTPLAVAYFHISLILQEVLCSSEDPYRAEIVASGMSNFAATYLDHQDSKSACEVVVIPRMVSYIEKE